MTIDKLKCTAETHNARKCTFNNIDWWYVGPNVDCVYR